MKRLSALEINQLVSKFSEKVLPKSEWTHQAHIIVALWHNMNHDFDSALELVKEKIKTYNLSVGTENTDEAGYHESLTIFWMIVSKSFLLQNPSLQLDEACQSFLQSEKASKNYPFEFYTRELMFSRAARKQWINGDIQKVSLQSLELKTNSHYDLSDEQFAKVFLDCTLDPALFSHEAHLRLAWIHLRKSSLESAQTTICNQIINFVTHLGEHTKYNQTLTIAAVKIVHHFLQQSLADNFFDFILEFPKLKTEFKDLIQSHYSFDIFNSVKAKENYLEPDLLAFE